MSEFRVSVIIPTFNHDRFIGDCLESVLQQNRPPQEVIVVDDGSTDTTPEVVAGFGTRVRYHRQENQGQAVARAWGLQQVTGELVCLLDSDDYWDTRFLAQAVPHFSDPSLGVAFANHDRVDTDGQAFQADVYRNERPWILPFVDPTPPDTWTHLDPEKTSQLYFNHFPHTPSGAVFRRSMMKHLPNRQLRRGDDYQFFMDFVIASRCATTFTMEILWHLRTHDSNIRQLGRNFGLLLGSDIQAKKELLRKHYPELQASEQRLLQEKIAEDYFSWAHGCAKRREPWSAYKYYCQAIRHAGLSSTTGKALAGMAKVPFNLLRRSGSG